MTKLLITETGLKDEFYLEHQSLRVFQFALLYLAIPAFLFLFGFAKPINAYPMALLIAIALWLSNKDKNSKDVLSLYLLALIPAIGVALLIGFPFGPFVWDWIKHWALINLLAENTWPVSINLNGAVAHLRFYIAAYLVPAELHKIWPALPVWATTGFWFVSGYALVFRLIVIPFGQYKKIIILLTMFAFLMFAGADFYAENFFRIIDTYKINNWFGLHYEMWFSNVFGAPMQYSSMLAGLTWVPHQSIATFIVTSMICLNRSDLSLSKTLLAFGLLALWSPYGMIGLLPLMVVLSIQQKDKWFSPSTVMSAIAGVAFTCLVALYLSTDMPTEGMCFSCAINGIEYMDHIVGFLAVELVVFGLILRKKILTDRMCLISFFTLLIIPFFGGKTPDFMMRGSMGPLFILSLRSLETLTQWRLQSNCVRALFLIAVTLCLPTVISECFYQVQKGEAHKHLSRGDPLGLPWYRISAQSSQINVQQFFDICDWRYLPQYFTYQVPNGIKENKK